METAPGPDSTFILRYFLTSDKLFGMSSPGVFHEVTGVNNKNDPVYNLLVNYDVNANVNDMVISFYSVLGIPP